MTADKKTMERSLRVLAMSFSIFWIGATCPAAAPAFQAPAGGFFPGWAKDGSPRTFQKMDLFNHIDGGAEIYLEFGFEKLTVQRYAKAEADLVLEVYEMEGPASALGLYLMKCGPETPWPEFGERNSSEPEQAMILKGRHIVQIDNPARDDGLVPAMKALAGRVLPAIAEEPAVSLLDRLPAAGRIPGSERLVRGPLALQHFFTFGDGDILSLGGRIFGVLAEYKGSSGPAFGRLIVTYGDEAEAAAALSYLREHLDPYLKIIKSGPRGFSFEDFAHRFGRVELAGGELDIRFRLTAAE